MYNDRLNVFLDLDNTLVHSVELRLLHLPDVRRASSLLEYKDFVINEHEGYRIFKRPELDTFLDALFKRYNVSIFTHADKDYAQFIVNEFILTKPGRRIEYFFYRYHVEMAMKLDSGGYKDLRLLWKTFCIFEMSNCNTVIVDDNPQVLTSNPYNTIPIVRFEIYNPFMVNDKELYDTLEKLRKCEMEMKTKCETNKSILE
jgi:TFIIF-interacting CTD phosphatase-like protein